MIYRIVGATWRRGEERYVIRLFIDDFAGDQRVVFIDPKLIVGIAAVCLEDSIKLNAGTVLWKPHESKSKWTQLRRVKNWEGEPVT